MTVRWAVARDCYRDSVTLLALSARLASDPAVLRASVAMATPANVAAAVDSGADAPLDATPADVLVVVEAATDEAAEAALAAGLEALSAPAWPAAAGRAAAGVAVEPPVSIGDALDATGAAAGRADGPPSVALISVPGPFAAAEARKALDAGLHVMIFSDNVALDDEVALKELGDARGRLVMGPDCGTAVLDGIPLGFANVVRRGPVGLVGASGTGLQEIATQLHRSGSGVSQLIGTGGRDLHAAVGGRSTLAALDLLGGDPATEVVVVVSKPPDPTVAARVLAAAGSLGKPVVAVLLGGDPAAATAAGVHPAATLAGAASLAVSLLAGSPAHGPSVEPSPGTGRPPRVTGAAAGPRRWLRGLFSGGTLGYEAQLVLAARGVPVASNAPIPGGTAWRAGGDGPSVAGHLVIDLGADEFTLGRPHPMIDPTVRDRWVVQALEDPTVAVLLLDVVLGHGASAEPVAGLVAALEAGRGRPGGPAVVAHVCGTDADPVARATVVAALTAAGVWVASSNAEAAAWAADLLPVEPVAGGHTEGAGR